MNREQRRKQQRNYKQTYRQTMRAINRQIKKGKFDSDFLINLANQVEFKLGDVIQEEKEERG